MVLIVIATFKSVLKKDFIILLFVCGSTMPAICLVYVCMYVHWLVRLHHSVRCLMGGEFSSVSQLRHSHQLHTNFSALVPHPLLGCSQTHTHTHTHTHPHTQTHSTVLDTYLTASNSLQSLLREDEVCWLCLEGFLPLS